LQARRFIFGGAWRDDMNASFLKVLLITDAPKDAGQLREMLREKLGADFELEWAESFEGGLERIRQWRPEVLLLDLGVAVAEGHDAVPKIQNINPRLAIIMLSTLDDEQAALSAVHQGAQDYLVKGQINAQLLVRSIRYAIERERAETAALQAEEKYREIFENTIEGIFQTSPEGQYISANRALARMYGFESPGELIQEMTNIGRDLYVEPGRRAEFIALMERHDQVSGFESRIYRRDRSIIWIAENVRAVRDPSGQLIRYEGTVEDTTERRRHEEELKNSETLYHSLVETLPQNIFRKNLNEEFTFANQRFCETVGKPLDQILGRTDFDFFPAELAAKYQQDDKQILESGKSFETVEANHLPGGETRYVYVVKTPLRDAQGRIIGLQGIFWDITEKRRAEENLKQANLDLAQSREALRLKNEEMEEDLRMARDIQQAMIPQQYPSFPPNALAGQSLVTFCHRYQPTGAVGGDFFNIRPLSDTRAGLFICDVMGHGVRSALVTAIVRALVEELTPEAAEPSELLSRMNYDLRAILRNSGAPLYTTAFYLIADLAEGIAWFSNAGHPKPMIIRASGEVELIAASNAKPNTALGLFDGAKYAAASISIQPGDRLVFFTDGVYDVEKDGELLSPEWLRGELQRLAPLPLPEIFDQILGQLRECSQGGEFEDDMCLVGMEVKGKAE